MKKAKLGLALILVLAQAVMAGPACGGDDGGAEFELSGLTIDPSSAGEGESVNIRVTVENVGDEEGSTEVTLEVDGDEVDSQNVTVAAGAERTVTFTHSEAAEGTYSIAVDGLSGTLTVTAGPGPTPTPTPTEGPGVGSTWEYLVDYEDEIDHPYTTTLVEVNATVPSFLCVPAAEQVTANLYETDTNPDGDCPPNPTKPKRPLAGYTIIPLSVESWQSAANGTAVALSAPICMTAPMPLGLISGTSVYGEYTAISGTVGKPYELGDKWTYTTTTNAEILGDCLEPAPGTSAVSTAEVVAVNETVTVPAGTFDDCVKIVETTEGATGSKTTWWSPTVQNTVKQIDDASYPPGTNVMELSSYDLK